MPVQREKKWRLPSWKKKSKYFSDEVISGGGMVCKLEHKPSRVSSSLLGCHIHSALCHIEAKIFVNFFFPDKGINWVIKKQQYRYTNLSEETNAHYNLSNKDKP